MGGIRAVRSSKDTSKEETSTAQKIAGGLAVTGIAAVGGSAVYALATKQTFTGLWAKWLKKAKSVF